MAKSPRSTLTRRRHLRGALGGAAGAALAGPVLAACGAGAPGGAGAPLAGKLQGKLDLWLWQRFWEPGTVGDAMVREFGEQNPQLAVSNEILPGGVPGREKVTAGVAAGVVPDVSYMDRFLAAEWGTGGIAQALNEKIKGSSTLNPGDWRDGLRSDVTWRDRVYAVPQGSEPWVFFWNSALFRESGLDPARAPATWDDLREYTRKIYRADAAGVAERYGFLPNYGNGGTQAAWLIFMWQQGQDELSPDRTKAVFDNERGLKALEFVVDLVRTQGGAQRFADFRTNAGPQGAMLLPAGKVAMHFDANSQASVWQRAMSQTNHAAGLIPKPPGGKDTTYQGGPSYVVPTGAKHPDNAIRFMEFFLRKENELRLADAFEAVPVSKTVAQSNEYLSKAPERKVYVQLALGAKWVPVVPGAAQILTVHSQFTADALNGTKSPRDALAAGQAEVQRILDQYVK
ncbi:MAG TPA: extracellular solute-binding protein [Chloroflexota bacterium]|nr:extracellular solute-binding protein [Chloroflexota bacterium]